MKWLLMIRADTYIASTSLCTTFSVLWLVACSGNHNGGKSGGGTEIGGTIGIGAMGGISSTGGAGGMGSTGAVGGISVMDSAVGGTGDSDATGDINITDSAIGGMGGTGVTGGISITDSAIGGMSSTGATGGISIIDSAIGDTDGSSTPPELITSGPNDYWNTTSRVTVTTSGTADLIVDENTKYQQWEGFGGTFNEMGWDALSVVSSEIPNALKLLFDTNDGANFALGRIPVGASDFAMSWYTLAETANDYSMTNFSIARDREKLIPYIKAALEIKSDIYFWASPWIVPDWMKDAGGNIKGDAQTQEAHALYLAKFVEEYAKEGITIQSIHPQNEPGWSSVRWTESLLVNYFKTYLGPKFAERNITAEIWCGTMSHPEIDNNVAIAVSNDADCMKYVMGFGLQWNLANTVPILAPKAPVWQTEHRCGNYNFSAPYWDQSRYDPIKPQNDHLYGEESWQLIRDWIVAGVTAYSAWNMVLDTYGRSLGGWPQNALLVIDRSAKTLTATAAYYVFRHFSQYIAPGATRIGTSGSYDVLAFKNPDGSIVIEVYNKGDSVKDETVKVDSAFYKFSTPSHGWATLRVIP